METKVFITTNEFGEATKEAMWNIYRHYYHYSKESFMARIKRNNYYSFYVHNDELVGFTGLKIDDVKINSKNVFLIYFGQTIILNDFRGKSLIPLTGFKLILMFWKKFLFSSVYFWADTLCYKPYLVFAKTLDEYYPSYQQATPKSVKTIIDYIGQTHYKENYDAPTGTVKKEINLVRDPSSVITDRDRLDPDIRFYEQANPHHPQGRGLITLGPGNIKNVRLIVYRFLKSIFYTSPAKRLQRAFARVKG